MSDMAVVPYDDRVDLERELAAAQRLARHPRCAPAVDALNLRIDATPWGVGYVEITDTTYEPSEAGDAALIVAAEAGGELVDLVVCRLGDRAMATRRGIATVLGEDALERARWSGEKLLLYETAAAWMHGGFVGAVVLDWRCARWAFADVSDIACATAALARRVHSTLTVPAQMPRLFFASAA